MSYTEVQQVSKPQVATFDPQYVFAAEAIVPENVLSMELAVHCIEMHIIYDINVTRILIFTCLKVIESISLHVSVKVLHLTQLFTVSISLNVPYQL